MTELKVFESVPGARRGFEAFRDFGYEFKEALADIVDNAIEAGADIVRIEAFWDGLQSYVSIKDNGKGMSAAELREAMRHGSEVEYDDFHLGKFGFGLKSASLSQCDRLTVASRQNPRQANITAYSWDSEHIKRSNKWEILEVPTNDLLPSTREHLRDTRGTVVTWQFLNKNMGYKNPSGEAAKKGFFALLNETEAHLAMVFHRFLERKVNGRKKLLLFLNQRKIDAWDPFAQEEKGTKELESYRVPVEFNGVRGTVSYEPFVLPHEKDFSSKSAHQHYSGPEKWNKQQGFYIYREDRMIMGGGWCGLRTQDEHLKCARIALTFPNKLDEAFKINVSKTRVTLPPDLKEFLKANVSSVIKIAQEVYRSGGKSLPKQPDGSVGPKKVDSPKEELPSSRQRETPRRDSDASPNSQSETEKTPLSSTNRHEASVDEIEKVLTPFVETKEEFMLLEKILRRLRKATGK